eukprot:TRINITY_DN59336_c0_g1_i1.p2 TRINITY_DN59336_c0_g1~~TRINITY_DN59336_c0_g1_i1.p2  ORF type:complete len:249 (-),score=38.85 TRINITY_DN59336_c0_g1_i1:48-794(-)
MGCAGSAEPASAKRASALARIWVSSATAGSACAPLEQAEMALFQLTTLGAMPRAGICHSSFRASAQRLLRPSALSAALQASKSPGSSPRSVLTSISGGERVGVQGGRPAVGSRSRSRGGGGGAEPRAAVLCPRASLATAEKGSGDGRNGTFALVPKPTEDAEETAMRLAFATAHASADASDLAGVQAQGFHSTARRRRQCDVAGRLQRSRPVVWKRRKHRRAVATASMSDSATADARTRLRESMAESP